MRKYLGETLVDAENTEFSDFTSSDWAIYFIERYGQYDGGHHKQWVLDQIARILKGSEIIIKEAKWDDGKSEYRISTGETSDDYKFWVQEMKGEYDGEEYQYSYETGIAP